MPKYEFARQMRSDILSQPLKLGPDELAIFEGIHALNDVIVGKNPKAFKLYIAAPELVVPDDPAAQAQPGVLEHHGAVLVHHIGPGRDIQLEDVAQCPPGGKAVYLPL